MSCPHEPPPNDPDLPAWESSSRGAAGPRAVQCSATSKRTGWRCRRHAVAGLGVCRVHGGARGSPARDKLEADKAEAKLRRQLGLPVGDLKAAELEVDPAEVLMGQLHEAAANVGVLRELVADIDPDDRLAAKHLARYDRERDRLARLAQRALAAGIDERRVRVAEETARQLADLVVGALARPEWGLSYELQATGRRVIASVLREQALDGGDTEEDAGDPPQAAWTDA